MCTGTFTAELALLASILLGPHHAPVPQHRRQGTTQCARVISGHAFTPFKARQLSFVVPQGYSVRRSHGRDYSYLSVRSDGDSTILLLTVYVGSAPHTPPRLPSQRAVTRTLRINGRTARSTEWQDKAGRTSRRVSISLAGGGTTQTIDVLYEGATHQAACLADSTIRSVRFGEH